MKYLKITLGLLILLLIGFVCYVLAFGSEARLEESIKIEAPASLVFEEINNFRTYSSWTVMNQLDSTTAYTYEGNISGIGAKRTWYNASPKVWNGSMEIVKSDPNTNVVIELMVDSNRDGDNLNDLKTPAIINYDLTEKDGITEVIRSIHFTQLEGVNKLRGTFISYMIGKNFKKGLVSLKQRIEEKPKFTKDLSIKPMMGITFLYKEVSSTQELFRKTSKSSFESVRDYMTDIIVQPAGYKIAQFTKYTSSDIQAKCGFPVGWKFDTREGFQIEQSYSGNVLRIIHVGPHEKLIEAHEEAQKYIKYYLHERTGDPYEIYIIEGDREPDSTKWRTDLYYPVK